MDYRRSRTSLHDEPVIVRYTVETESNVSRKTTEFMSNKYRPRPIDFQRPQTSELMFSDSMPIEFPRSQSRNLKLLDRIHSKLDEPTQALLDAFRLFDREDSGAVSKGDCHQILQQFGFSMTPWEEESFYSRCGLRVVQGKINYINLLRRFQNRSEDSLLKRLIKSKYRNILGDLRDTGRDMSAEEAELKILRYIQDEYLLLVDLLKDLERRNPRGASLASVRDVIETFLGTEVSSREFNTLVKEDLFHKAGDHIPHQNLKLLLQTVSVSHSPVPMSSRQSRDFRDTYDVRGTPRYEMIPVYNAKHELLLEKISPKMIQDWEKYRKRFREMDPNGYGDLPRSEVEDLLRRGFMPLNEVERKDLLQHFDLKNNARVNYVELMKACKRKEEEQKTRQSRAQTAPVGRRRTPRGMDTSRSWTSDSLQLFIERVLSNWKCIRQAFKALDFDRDAFIGKEDLRRSLVMLGMRSQHDDIYHILSQFDQNMDGKISYNEFLEKCLPL